MIRWLIILFFYYISVYSYTLMAQKIYISEPDYLYKYNVNTCQKEVVCYIPGTAFSDIAFHPDGSLFGVAGT